MGGKGGVGWGSNVHVNLNTHVMLRSGIFSCTCTHTNTRHATLWHLLLHLHTHVMLRSGIFSCTCTHTSCYALGSSLALAHTQTHVMKFPLPMSKFNVPNHTRNAMKKQVFVISKLVSDAVIFNTEMNERYVNNESMMICQKKA